MIEDLEEESCLDGCYHYDPNQGTCIRNKNHPGRHIYVLYFKKRELV